MDLLLRRLELLFVLGDDSVHGPRHWARVARYGQALAEETGADPHVVQLFALFHDSCRRNESTDPEHGRRGGARAREWCGRHFHLEPHRLELLVEACNDHTDGVVHRDPTIGTCWDSDRLDLDRVLPCELDLRFFSTEAGRKLALLPARARHAAVGLGSFR